jgi:huntingtin-interacting protein 1-related protein
MQDPPNLMDSGDAPSLPARPRTAMKTPPPAAPSPNAAEINEQARMLKEYEDQQKALQAAREAEERRRQELEAQQQAEFARRQQEQAERERLAQEQLMQQQMMQYNNQAAQQASELEREMLAMRGQYERDQLLLEQYDRVRVPVLHC